MEIDPAIQAFLLGIGVILITHPKFIQWLNGEPKKRTRRK